MLSGFLSWVVSIGLGSSHLRPTERVCYQPTLLESLFLSAIARDQVETVQVLLLRDPSLAVLNDNFPIQMAATHGSKQTAKLLLKYPEVDSLHASHIKRFAGGAIIEDMSTKLENALGLAQRMNHASIFKALVKHQYYDLSLPPERLPAQRISLLKRVYRQAHTAKANHDITQSLFIDGGECVASIAIWPTENKMSAQFRIPHPSKSGVFIVNHQQLFKALRRQQMSSYDILEIYYRARRYANQESYPDVYEALDGVLDKLDEPKPLVISKQSKSAQSMGDITKRMANIKIESLPSMPKPKF